MGPGPWAGCRLVDRCLCQARMVQQEDQAHREARAEDSAMDMDLMDQATASRVVSAVLIQEDNLTQTERLLRHLTADLLTVHHLRHATTDLMELGRVRTLSRRNSLGRQGMRTNRLHHRLIAHRPKKEHQRQSQIGRQHASASLHHRKTRLTPNPRNQRRQRRKRRR